MKVINIYAEPSAGKTTAMLSLTSTLKKMGFSADIGSEYYKELVYQNTPEGQEDNLEEITKRTHDMVERLGGQHSIYANQRARLKRLNGNVDFAVTDCPLPLIAYYSKNDPDPFLGKSIQFSHNQFDNIDILIKRNHEYEKTARVHSEEASMKIASELPNFLEEFCEHKKNNKNMIVVESSEEIEYVILFELMKAGLVTLPKHKQEKVELRSGMKLSKGI